VEVTRALAGAGCRVTVTDLRGADELAESLAALAGLDVRRRLGGHALGDFTTADVVVASPAVAPGSEWLEAARAAGAETTSETELFLEACPSRLALVTGTQGKSSTAHLTASLLAACGVRTHLGGNIGRSLLNELAALEAGDTTVLELSSYQLEALPAGVGHLARNVAAVAVTNVLADHLERHGSLEAYEAAKRRVLKLAPPGARRVLPADDERVRGWPRSDDTDWFGAAPDATLRIEDGAFVRAGEVLGRTADLALSGAFQRTNALCALGLARALGARGEDLVRALPGVRGLPHRLEDLGLFAGHRVWDNGVSTTPDSTVSALAALEGPLVLLAGGRAKDLPLDELARTAAERAACVVTFGASGPALAEACAAAGAEAVFAGALESAVREAFARMGAGAALLFSPACASFDAYRNFSDRAKAFRRALPR